MRAELIGTAGPAGWPEPGCRCASCRRASAAGGRRPACVLVDGVLRLGGGERPLPRPGYRATDIPGGWEVTGPSGRLLCSAGPGGVPVPAPDACRYDIALLDLLADPAQLGLLRRRGLVTGGTVVAALHADHRVSSPAELTRRCALWGVVPAADGEVLTAPDRDAAGREAPAPEVYRTFVLGGARSGKSGEAELRLAAEPQVRYVATGRQAGGDTAWAARVAAHRARRPPWWQTVETTDVAAELGRAWRRGARGRHRRLAGRGDGRLRVLAGRAGRGWLVGRAWPGRVRRGGRRAAAADRRAGRGLAELRGAGGRGQ